MSDKIVAGADLEPAKDTWLAVGKLGSLGLEIIELKHAAPHALGRSLGEHQSVAGFGISAPFSYPQPFLEFVAASKPRKDYQSWQEVAEELAFMPYDDFVVAAKEFKKETKRLTDTANGAGADVPSPLHRGTPPLAQTTFQNIRLLASLDPKKFFIVPFQDRIDFGCPVIEVSAMRTLKYFGIAERGYQGQDKKGESKLVEARRKTLTALTSVRERKGVTYQDCPRLTVPKKFEHDITTGEHALDAVIACYTTALYVAAPKLFADPFDCDQLEVLLEGWTFVPMSTK